MAPTDPLPPGFRAAALSVLLMASLAAGCAAAPPTQTLCLLGAGEPVMVTAELATTAAQRRRGLQDRDHLPADGAMLFRFERPQPAGASFWMYRTRIPLDIAFLDAGGIIHTIHTMPPCTESDPTRCPRYPAARPFHQALEVNGGFFARHRIGPGDRVAPPQGAQCSP